MFHFGNNFKMLNKKKTPRFTYGDLSSLQLEKYIPDRYFMLHQTVSFDSEEGKVLPVGFHLGAVCSYAQSGSFAG